ncbi:MAG TPA: hypothetical protein V6D14_23995 [Coleofasciculaceae cyanobacterium]|jgi:hypothetical protein
MRDWTPDQKVMKDVSDSDSSIADAAIASKDESSLSNCREAPEFIHGLFHHSSFTLQPSA